MDETSNFIEMERLNSDASLLAAAIGQTRRRNRSLKGVTGELRRGNTNIVADLPSRNNLGIIIDATGMGSGNEFLSGANAQADKIVEQMEINDDGDDALKSVKDKMENLRKMPESLTLKRSIRSKLMETLDRRGRKGNVPITKRVEYSLNIAFFQTTESLKEMMVRMELWYNKLKTVEGHFGSGVATYFKFLRTLLFINFCVFLVSLLFIVVPQIILIAQDNTTIPSVPFTFGNIFTGEGYLSETVLFYGYYSNETLNIGDVVYNIPSAYFFTALVNYFLVFVLLSTGMAISFRKNFIESAGGHQNVFANKVFCAWDFGIATEEAADLKAKGIHTELKELIQEQNIKERKKTWWQLMYNWGMQFSLNLLLLACLAVAAYFMWRYLSSHSTSLDTPTSMMISLSVTLAIHLLPIVLIWLLRYEGYDSPRTATYVTIARTFVLDAVLIGVLVAYRLNAAWDSHVCWETALGQEIYRLVLLDFLVGLVVTPLAQFIRRRIYLAGWEAIGYPEIDVARNTINLLYNEALFFIGLYFSPVLSLVILVKLWLTFYIRYWGAVNDCRPSTRMWRAAQTQTVFLTTAFIAFILVLVLYGYILSSVRTSTCGPFRGQKIMYEDVVQSLSTEDSTSLVLTIVLYVRKPGVVAIILVAMLLLVYYLRAIGRARSQIVQILQDILHLQAKDKEYLLDYYNKLTKLHPEFSESQRLGVRFKSEQELRPSFSNETPNRNSKNLARSRSLFNVDWDDQQPSTSQQSNRNLNFNPIFTESVREDTANQDEGYGDFRRTPKNNVSLAGTPGAKYLPTPHDDRIPSLIAFPAPPSRTPNH